MALTSNSMSNSYFSRLWIYQHFPNHLVPSLLDSNRNQSLSAPLLFCTYCERNENVITRSARYEWNRSNAYQSHVHNTEHMARLFHIFYWINTCGGSTWIKAWYSSFSLCTHKSLSRGPAFVLRTGIQVSDFFVTSSTIFNLSLSLTVPPTLTVLWVGHYQQNS